MLDEPVPVTIVTGWDARRTGELIDQLVCSLESRHIAVVGARRPNSAAAPAFFVESEAEISEQSAGCPCCVVRSDLVRIVANLTRRIRPPEWILLEAAGWTDPVIAGQTFLMEPTLAGLARLDGIVTVIDGSAVGARLRADESVWPDPLAGDQVAVADRVVVTGTPSTDVEDLASAVRAASATNGSAEVIVNLGGEFDPAEVLCLEAFGPSGAAVSAARGPGPTRGADRALSGSAAHVVEATGVLDQGRLEAWLDALHESRDCRLLRLDGVLAIRGRDRQVIFQGIGSNLNRWRGRRFAPGEPRTNRLVVAGRNLDASSLRATLAECVAS